MGRKKIPNETKLKYAKLSFENRMSKCEAARQVGVRDSDVLGWVYRYCEQGELAFLDNGENLVYSDGEARVLSASSIDQRQMARS